ncbi:hypothetical protein ASG51_11920 [Methylobacterium sp. Leaf465]|uniref:hypothetical protein n=1 Tax=Methylobacterium sp. Leaf465 TaxID=1736385 RepID=UPI0006FA09CD|nr:hypothetical protein [Methylobacterium sp. Leaf465]KQT70887.1 hypothetical protein ASG51_11920 [Methylobacterium sp. Leaf465]
MNLSRAKGRQRLGLLLAATLAASGVGVGPTSAEEGNVFMNMLKFGGTTVPPSQPDDTDPPYCPTVAVPEGGAAIQSYAGRAGDGTSLRHQVTIGRLARECAKLQDGSVSVKVGVEGQVLLGPVGKPGRFEAPVSISIKAGDKVVLSRVHRVPVTVPAGAAQGLFSFVEDNLVVPAAMARDYDIEVRLGAAPQKTAPRKKKKPAVSATSEDRVAAPATDAAE